MLLKRHEGGTDTEIAQKLTLDKKSSPATPAGTQTQDLSITSLVLLPQSYPHSPIMIPYSINDDTVFIIYNHYCQVMIVNVVQIYTKNINKSNGHIL